MKKLLISMALILACTGTVYATGVNGSYHGHDIVKVTYEGQEVKPDSVPGYIDGGSTMIPLGMMRKMGFTVDWNAKTLAANVTTKKPDTVAKTPLTMEQIKGLSNAVAIVYALDDSGKRWRQGSGFLINSHGLMITAYHVAEEEGKLRALEVEVNGKTYKVPAGVNVFADQQKDIFGVYLQDAEAFPYLKVNIEPPKDGTAYTISNPNGQRNIVTQGYISAVYTEKGVDYVNGLFETDHGSSGGPLIDSYGQAIGLIFGGPQSTSITFTVAMKDVVELYEKSLNQ